MKRKIFILFFIFLFLLLFDVKNVDASYKLDKSNIYIDIESTSEIVDVHIDERIASILKEANIDVKDNQTRGGFLNLIVYHDYYYSTYDYKYYIKQYKELSNDIYTIAYMTDRIENYAKSYNKGDFKK